MSTENIDNPENEAAEPEGTNSTAIDSEAAAGENEQTNEENKPSVALMDIKVNGRKLATSLTSMFEAKEWPEFGPGDTIKVHYRITEGDKQRIQIYQGTVIGIRGEGHSRSFMVRRVSHDVGVERIFPFHSPSIAKIEVVRKGSVRRARLFFLRGKSGKEGRIKEAYMETPKSTKKAKKGAKKKKAEKEAAQPAPTVAGGSESES